MLTSIHPLGERARQSKWTVTVAAYMIGATVGGVAIGAAAGTVGWLVHVVAAPTVTATAVVAAGAAAMAMVIDAAGVSVPSIHRQVNEDWLTTYRGWVYGVGFGFQLGAAVATIIPTAATYLFLLLAVLSGSPLLGAIIGGAFGLGRGLSILAARRVRTPAALRHLMRTMSDRAVRAHRAVVLSQIGAAAAAVMVAV